MDTRYLYEKLILKGSWIVIGTVCVLVFALGYFFDISHVKNKLSTAKEHEVTLKDQFKNLINQENNLRSDILVLPSVKQLLLQFKNNMQKVNDLATSLNEVLKQGESNQLQFNLFNPGTATIEGSYNKVPIKMVVVGSYDQIANFMSQLANMLPIVAINDFTISSNPKDKSLTTAMNVEVYFGQK